MNTKFAKYLEIIFFPLNPIAVSLFLITAFVSTMFIQDLTVLTICTAVFLISHFTVRRKVKEENKKYFISSAVLSIVFFALSQIIGVSRELFLVGITLFIIAMFTYAIRPKWKISAHMIGFVSTVTIGIFFNPYIAFLYILIPLIAWCRLKLNRHNIYQIIAGTILGLLVPFVTFSLYF